MKTDFRASLRAARTRLGTLPALFKAHRFWFSLAGATFAVLTAMGLVGRAVLTRAASMEEEGARLDRILQATDRWVARFQPPTAVESLIWNRSEEVLRDSEPESVDPAAIAHLTAQHAEDLGIREVGVHLEGAEEPGAAQSQAQSPAPGAVGQWSLERIPSALSVEFAADPSVVEKFIDGLPPYVEVESLGLTREGDGLRVMMRLIVYQAKRRG